MQNPTPPNAIVVLGFIRGLIFHNLITTYPLLNNTYLLGGANPGGGPWPAGNPGGGNAPNGGGPLL